MENYFDEQKEDIIQNNLQAWSALYKVHLKLVENKRLMLMGAIALQNSIEMQRNLINGYGEKKKRYFEELLIKLKESFDPESYLKSLEDTLICLKLSDKSYLYEKLGTLDICGQYWGLADGVTTRIKEDGNDYVEKESNVSFILGYPTYQDRLKVTFYDLENLDNY